ncbi:MAG: Fe-S protein assembly co-chaperone HscB [Ostreibacterium sp.]
MNTNPFQLFGLPVDYMIDKKVINDKYLMLQKKFHPDNFSNYTSKEKLMATQISANIVEGHKLLSNPIARASLLLNLSGLNFSLDEYISRDKMLLMQQMELREQLTQASSEQLVKLKTTFEHDFADLEQQFVTELGDKQLESAAETVLKMRYYQKLLAELTYKQKI